MHESCAPPTLSQERSPLLPRFHPIAAARAVIITKTLPIHTTPTSFSHFPPQYFWGSTPDSDFTFTMSDAKPTERFRTLLRFGNLQRYVPAGSVVQSAQLTVTFINWGGPVLVEGCFMTRPWSPLLNGPRCALHTAPSIVLSTASSACHYRGARTSARRAFARAVSR